MSGVLTVDAHLSIPRSELSFRASRSGGAGGQHVNKTSTRVELVWNPAASRALSQPERERIAKKLASRMDSRGNIRVVASAFRSQGRNREDAEVKLAALIRRALAVPKVRGRTRPTKSSVEKRLREKHRHSEKKEQRRTDADD